MVNRLYKPSATLKKSNSAAALALCFLVPALIMLVVYAKLGVHPFGEKSLLISDMDIQYSDFYQGCRYMTSGETSPIFSWHMALGTNYFGLFTYYLSSPLSFIPSLFPTGSLPDGILLMTILKIGLCGLCFGIFAKKVFIPHSAVLPGMAAAYALSSYVIVYAMMPMWLDSVALLPIMALGVERLVKKGSSVILIFSVSAAIIFNYYTAYMAIISVIIWFFYRLAYNAWKTEKSSAVRLKKPNLAIILRFAISLLTSVCICAFVLLPSFLSLRNGRAGGISFDFDAISPLALTKKLLPGAYDSYHNSSTPYIYSGIIVTALCLLYFFRKTVSVRRKIITACLLIVFALLLCLSIFNALFHMFSPPAWFHYRYAFIAPFLLVSLACQSVSGIDFSKIKNFNIFASVKTRNVIAASLTILICADMFINASSLTSELSRDGGYRPYASWLSYMSQTEPVIDAIKSYDDGFYRIEKDFQRDYNDPISLGFNGISHYSSAYKAATNDFLRELGLWQGWFWSSGRGSTLVSDTLLGVRYRLSFADAMPGYKLLFSQNGINVFENAYALPVAFLGGGAEKNISGDIPSASNNPFIMQNEIINALSPNTNDCFIPIKYEADPDSRNLIVTALTNGLLYIYLTASQAYPGVFVYANGKYIDSTAEERGIAYTLCLGNFSAGEEVQITLDVAGGGNSPGAFDQKYLIYQLNEETLKTAANILNDNEYSIYKIFSNGLYMTINTKSANGADTLYTSIPYDEGWRITLDGIMLNTQKFEGALLSAMLPENLSAGEHVIKMSFTPPGLLMGSYISCAAILAAVIFIIFKRRGKVV